MIYEIEQALKRIKQGSYGICELTGTAIPKARLRAIPWTRFCKSAEAQIEAETTPGTRRIGELRPIRDAGRVSATVK
jgi:RNA polymerase-binding transcription factor DksA